VADIVKPGGADFVLNLLERTLGVAGIVPRLFGGLFGAFRQQPRRREVFGRGLPALAESGKVDSRLGYAHLIIFSTSGVQGT
jgi:hypothetical protein